MPPRVATRTWRPRCMAGCTARGARLGRRVPGALCRGVRRLRGVSGGLGLWLGSDPELYAQLFDNPRYLTTVANTLMLVGFGVNVQMFLAFLLSGFFLRPSRR